MGSFSWDKQASTLNSWQYKAVHAPQEPTLVLAGAGTGKTRVLTLRYAYLVHHYGLCPSTLMAVTFTNKAAYEMKHRLQSFFPLDSLWVGTFHSLGMRLLRQHASKIGRKSDFVVLDNTDQSHILQKLLIAEETKKPYTPQMVREAINQWKQSFILPHEVKNPRVPLFLSLYHAYQSHLETMNCFDFDDLVMMSLKLVEEYPHVIDDFQHVLVDEYQDVNEMQYRWLQAFAKKGAHLFCVGDDDQSIYGWRGASVEKILCFSDDFPHSHVIYLEDNYRSSPHILSAASHLIAHNQTRYGKSLKPQNLEGEKIYINGLWDSTEEAAFIAQEIMRFSHKGTPLSSMAILVRTGAQTREFEEHFTLCHLPYVLVGSTRFYERMEVKDFISYLRAVKFPSHHLAFERIINVPKRGIGNGAMAEIHALAKNHGLSLQEAAKLFCQDKPEKSLWKLLQLMEDWRRDALTMTPALLGEKILEESGYHAMWQSQGIQGQARLDNIKELIKSMEGFSTLESFLEHVSLLAEGITSPQPESISLMTLHAAKGLEFDTVFLPGWEENLFPHIRSIEEGGRKGIEEERRLAYVGLTRAKRRSFISFSWHRRHHQGLMPSQPSRFIKELPAEDTVVCLHRSYHRPSSPQGKTKVMHALFGEGIVENQTGSIVSVLFKNHGLKKVMARFLDFLP